VARILSINSDIVIEAEQLSVASSVPDLIEASFSNHPAAFTVHGLGTTRQLCQVSASALLCGEYTGLRTAVACGLTVLGQGIITMGSMHAHSS
jgi:hypothetical protein